MDTIDYQITIAAPSQADEILAVQKTSFMTEAIRYSDFNIHPLTQTTTQLLEEFHTATILVATTGSAIIGTIRATSGDSVCHIKKLAVLPQYRHRGIGRHLVRAIEAQFPSVHSYQLFTGRDSAGNIAMYQSLGYTIRGTHDSPGGVPFVDMIKLNTPNPDNLISQGGTI